MKKIIKICLWVTAVVPIIVDSSVFYPYVSGKNIVFQTSLILVAIFFVYNYFYSKDFRQEIERKIIKYFRGAVVVSGIGVVITYIISTFFAVDKYVAFWGELSRAEGLAGALFFLFYSALCLLIFEKKDWLRFLKASLLVTLVLVGKQALEFFHHINRPPSFSGNPTFLSGYLLYSIGFSLIIYFEDKKKYWRIIALLTLVLSVLGIFLAETRAVILGLFVGLIFFALYCALKSGSVKYKNIRLKKIAITFLTLLLVFSGVFFATRTSSVWQNIPGLSRFATTGKEGASDVSTKVRLFIYESAINSIRPDNNGWGRLLIGWGPDNFYVAINKYYLEEQYGYEQNWNDRAHNKLLDILVMNGLLGLLAYLALVFSYLRDVFKTNAFNLIHASLLLSVSGYFVSLMFFFDHINTSIPAIFSLAFLVYLKQSPEPDSAVRSIKPIQVEKSKKIMGLAIWGVLLALLLFIYFANTLPGYIQMKGYSSFISKVSSLDLEEKISFTPFTSAQAEIRRNLLDVVTVEGKSPGEINAINIFFDIAVSKAEDYLSRRPTDARFMFRLATALSYMGKEVKSDKYLVSADYWYRKADSLSPNRPNIIRGLALNLLYMSKFEDAYRAYNLTLDPNPLVSLEDRGGFYHLYTNLLKYFYEKKDIENFIKTSKLLIKNQYSGSDDLSKLIDLMQKNGRLPVINFN